MSLNQFHHYSKNGEATQVYDNAIFEYLKENNRMFVVGGTPYFYTHENGVYIADNNGAWLKSQIKKLIYPSLIKSTTIERIYKLFLMDYDLQIKTEDLNNYPKHWIHFNNCFYDPIAQETVPHSPSYKAVNVIPHDFSPAASFENTTVIDDWLRFITPDEDDREMLLEYLGYCMTCDTRQQKFLILCGQGGSGKSTVIRMLESVIGKDNISNISLKELTQRFASYGLLGKLLNSCADLETSALEDTSILKKILGEDTIRAEAKGKDAISFHSFAKLIFSTNELPIIVAEKTNGFYRRLMVLKMDKVPAQQKHDFLESLLKEQDYFIHLCVKALERMYSRGMIYESWNSIKAVEALRKDSDTVEAWLADKCSLMKESEVERSALFDSYELYCNMSDRTPLTRNSFYRSLRTKGFNEHRTQSSRFFTGISLEKKQSSLPDDSSLPF